MNIKKRSSRSPRSRPRKEPKEPRSRRRKEPKEPRSRRRKEPKEPRSRPRKEPKEPRSRPRKEPKDPRSRPRKEPRSRPRKEPKEKKSRLRKSLPPHVPEALFEQLTKNGYTLGKLLGEGTFSVVYEVTKDGEKYALKINKKGLSLSNNEYQALASIGELIANTTKRDVIIIKYCGEGFHSMWKRTPYFMSLKDATVSLLESINQLHIKGWIHCDIKSDNICVIKTGKHKYQLKLMDFGNVQQIAKGLSDLPLSDGISARYPQYAWVKNVNDLKRLADPDINIFNITNNFHGNKYWSLRSILVPKPKRFSPSDDVEAAALTLWMYYSGYQLPWKTYYKGNGLLVEDKDKPTIVKLRMDESLCPFPILQEVLREARKGNDMNLTDLIERIKKM